MDATNKIGFFSSVYVQQLPATANDKETPKPSFWQTYIVNSAEFISDFSDAYTVSPENLKREISMINPADKEHVGWKLWRGITFVAVFIIFPLGLILLGVKASHHWSHTFAESEKHVRTLQEPLIDRIDTTQNKISDFQEQWDINASNKDIVANIEILKQIFSAKSQISDGEILQFLKDNKVKPSGGLLGGGKSKTAQSLDQIRPGLVAQYCNPTEKNIPLHGPQQNNLNSPVGRAKNNPIEFKRDIKGTETFRFKYSEGPLNKVVNELKNSGSVERKKAALMQQGLDHLHQLVPNNPDIDVTRMTDPSAFQLTDKKTPAYFSYIWSGTESTEVTTTSDFFDYNQNDDQQHVYTDFANQRLGGAWKSHGFVQEEIMAFEDPSFGALLAHIEEQKIRLMTRNPNRQNQPEGTLGGSPNPLIIQGIIRVQAVDAFSPPNSKAYNNGINQMTQQQLLDTTAMLDDPQDVKLLAIAAPKLQAKNPSFQYSAEALKDSFNTLVAGATLAKTTFDDPNRPLVIHSGKLGAGVFNNSTEVIYLLHRLAKGYTGVDYVLHAYDDDETNRFEATWELLAPKFQNKSLERCLNIMSQHLKKRAGLI